MNNKRIVKILYTHTFLSFELNHGFLFFYFHVCTYNRFKSFKAAAAPLMSVKSEEKKREKKFELFSAGLSFAVGLL